MNVTIQGHVIGVADDYKAILLLLEQQQGTKTNTVAVRCWGNQVKERAQQFSKGDLVEAFGRISSRQGKTGDRWFTSFEAEGLRLVEAANAKPPVANPNPAPPPDGEDIPF